MRAGSETEKAQPGAAKETDRDAALTDAGACSDGSRARCRPCSWSPCRRLRPLPLQKAGRLRVRAFNYPVVNVRDLVALHLPNAPSDDPLYPGLLGRGISQLIPKRRDVAGRIDLEDSGDPLGGHPALELLLDCGLADARGRRTQGARRDHVDDSIIGVQGERRSRIPAGDGVDMALRQPRWITLSECDRGSDHQGSGERCHEADGPIHGVPSCVAYSLRVQPREMFLAVVGSRDVLSERGDCWADKRSRKKGCTATEPGCSMARFLRVVSACSSSHACCSARGRRSLRHTADRHNKPSRTYDFDPHRDERNQNITGPGCPDQPKGRENTVADDGREQCARCRRAQKNESTKLRTILRRKGCGNAAAVDIHPACYSHEDRKPERIAVDRDYDFAERPHLVGRTVHHGIPGETSLHGDEHGGDHQNGGETDSSGSLHERPDRELGRDSVRVAEIRDRAPLGLLYRPSDWRRWLPINDPRPLAARIAKALDRNRARSQGVLHTQKSRVLRIPSVAMDNTQRY